MSWEKIRYVEQLVKLKVNDLLLQYEPSFSSIPDTTESSAAGIIFEVEGKQGDRFIIKRSAAGSIEILIDQKYILQEKNWFIKNK